MGADALRDIWKQVCAITHQYRPDLRGALDEICRWAEANDGHLEQLTESYLREELQIISQEAGLDLALLKFLLNHTLRPFLRRYAQTVAPWINTNNWYQPYCPVCGGEPDFAVLEKPHGARRLLCSRCDFEWPYRRTSCPYCGCEDSEKYQYALSEDNVYRLYLCDNCYRYLKTLDLREVFEDRLLPIERIVTLPMDIAAYRAGYGGM
ncbi:MAG: formate dehydrogenase accessory protein FdhE [Anaerolineae bacterium]